VENNDNQDTVVSSEVSRSRVKRRTGKTASLTPVQSLEILQQSILECRRAGVSARIAPMYLDGDVSIIVVLANCQIADGKIVLANTGNDPQPTEKDAGNDPCPRMK
jgi:hypothetical protein